MEKELVTCYVTDVTHSSSLPPQLYLLMMLWVAVTVLTQSEERSH